MYDRKEAEGTKRRHQVDTIVEGMCVPSSFLIGGLKLVLVCQRDQSDDEQYRFGAAHHQ